MAKGLFATYHPAVCMLFFLATIGFAFSTQHPAYVLLAIVMSGAYLVYLRGWRSFLRTMDDVAASWGLGEGACDG